MYDFHGDKNQEKDTIGSLRTVREGRRGRRCVHCAYDRGVLARGALKLREAPDEAPLAPFAVKLRAHAAVQVDLCVLITNVAW